MREGAAKDKVGEGAANKMILHVPQIRLLIVIHRGWLSKGLTSVKNALYNCLLFPGDPVG